MYVGVNSTNENDGNSTGLLVVAHQQLTNQIGIDQAAVSTIIFMNRNVVLPISTPVCWSLNFSSVIAQSKVAGFQNRSSF